MLLERYYDDSLAQASYLIGCEQSGEAIVIDPNVLERYERAGQRRLRVKYVTETHIHADYLSGSRQLAKEHGATLLLSGHGGSDWSYADKAGDGVRLLRDGDTITIGNVRLTVLHTPGHTPEHICFIVTDAAASDQPMGIVSGDFVFVGDVGRPDLLEKAAKVAGSMESSARDLFRSLQGLRTLPDYLQVWPGHGAGSACGKSLGSLPQSTLGYERLYNPAFKTASEDAFVSWVLSDQPEPPPYFARMKRLNRDGWTMPQRADGVGWPSVERVEQLLHDGAQVVDPRPSREFAKGHVMGTINIPETRSFVTYAGTVLDYDQPVIVLANNPDHAAHLSRRLALIGLWPTFARLDMVAEVAKRSPSLIVPLPTIDAAQLAEQMKQNGMRVIDVRGRSEWEHGHLPKAEHIYLGELAERATGTNMPRDARIVVHCETGTRSSIGASLLMARGFTNVTNFAGGYAAWRKAGLPVEGEKK